MTVSPEHDAHDGRVRRGTTLDRLFWPGVAVAAVMAVLAASGGSLPGVGRMVLARPAPVDAWLLECRGIDLPVMLRRAGNRLDVPPELAPAPLPALTGRDDRYGDGKLLVEVRGVDATIWPNGPAAPPLACTAPRRRFKVARRNPTGRFGRDRARAARRRRLLTQ